MDGWRSCKQENTGAAEPEPTIHHYVIDCRTVAGRFDGHSQTLHCKNSCKSNEKKTN